MSRALALLCLLASCSQTFRAEVAQPDPLAMRPGERNSEEARVVLGDMDLEAPLAAGGVSDASPAHMRRVPLVQSARFSVVSRDMLRFHVRLERKWPDWADLRTWKAELTDDAGMRMRPESIERVRVRHETIVWDREVRTPVLNAYGDAVGTYQDGWKDRQTLGSIDYHRGTGDLVFRARDIAAGHRWIRLTLSRPGERVELTWRLTD